MINRKVPVQSLIDHIKTAVDVDPWAKEMAEELLKEQDAKMPVKPHYNARTNWYECGACRYSMTSGMNCRSELIPCVQGRILCKMRKGGKNGSNNNCR